MSGQDWWNGHRVDELRLHVAAKRSALEICTIMGAKSRNAVIGKCHRIGLQLLGGHVHFADGSPKPRYAKQRGRSHKAKDGSKKLTRTLRMLSTTSLYGPTTPAPAAVEVSRADLAAAQARATEDAAVASKGIGLFEAGQDQCRWPLNWPSPISKFRFCGKHTDGGPYCSTHHARASARPRTFAEAAE